MLRSNILLALAAMTLSACSFQVLPGAGTSNAAGALSCGGGPSFSADLLRGPGGAENGVDPAATALRRHLATNNMEVDLLPDEGWIEVARTDALALYLAPVPAAEGSWHFVSVGRDGGEWDVDGWGGCSLQPDVGPDLGIASFRVAPDAALDPEATEIAVLVTERDCNSGQDARGRIVVASIEEGDDSVTVTFAVNPRGGAQSCPSNPETPFVLGLPNPLGQRTLLDGSSVPPRDATACPDIAPCP